MTDKHDPPPGPPRPVWQPRFSVASLLLTMLLFCVMAGAASYLARALRDGDRTSQMVFLLMILAGPMLLMVLVSLIRWLILRRR